ncbi:MAG: hypothetical protein CMH30_05160 [Micavibrio sp.]|nr:hypothetical protein [Micavibrio sp.]|tara:strand:+ start:1107 stop:2093 length:987 start_codon:yes stop_codon:yes gene_type:complete
MAKLSLVNASAKGFLGSARNVGDKDIETEGKYIVFGADVLEKIRQNLINLSDAEMYVRQKALNSELFGCYFDTIDKRLEREHGVHARALTVFDDNEEQRMRSYLDVKEIVEIDDEFAPLSRTKISQKLDDITYSDRDLEKFPEGIKELLADKDKLVEDLWVVMEDRLHEVVFHKNGKKIVFWVSFDIVDYYYIPKGATEAMYLGRDYEIETEYQNKLEKLANDFNASSSNVTDDEVDVCLKALDRIIKDSAGMDYKFTTETKYDRAARMKATYLKGIETDTTPRGIRSSTASLRKIIHHRAFLDDCGLQVKTGEQRIQRIKQSSYRHG